MLLKRFFFYPASHLPVVIPAVLGTGFIIGYAFDLSRLQSFILPATFLMIYPTMIGFQLKDAFNLAHGKILLWSVLLNFVLIPILAYGLGTGFFLTHPQMFAGLAIASLLPTSGMTISWTMISNGNVAAAIKMTVVGLLLGSFLAPWYLLIMVGQYVPIDVVHIFKIITVVVISPLILGHFTFRLLMRRYSPSEFKKLVKPYLPAFSVWAMLFVIFVSTAMKAKMMLQQPQLLVTALAALIIFYTGNFVLSTILGRWQFQRDDALALVFGTVLRNLSISLGIAVSAFGAEAALIVTLAFIIQVQSAAWYTKLAERLNFFPQPTTGKQSYIQEA